VIASAMTVSFWQHCCAQLNEEHPLCQVGRLPGDHRAVMLLVWHAVMNRPSPTCRSWTLTTAAHQLEQVGDCYDAAGPSDHQMMNAAHTHKSTRAGIFTIGFCRSRPARLHGVPEHVRCHQISASEFRMHRSPRHLRRTPVESSPWIRNLSHAQMVGPGARGMTLPDRRLLYQS